MNKKGFTLVEILSVLVLIGLLFGLAIPGINKISSNMKKKSYSKKVSLVESAAELWGQDNKTLLQSSSDCEIKGGEKVSCYKITVGSLIENNYLDSDKNSGEYISPLDNSDMKNQCVYVYKKNNRVYSYFAGNKNLECSNVNQDDSIAALIVTITPIKDSISQYNIDIQSNDNIILKSATLTVKDSQIPNADSYDKNEILSDSILDVDIQSNKGKLEYDFISELERKYNICSDYSDRKLKRNCLRSTKFDENNLTFDNELKIEYEENGNNKTETYIFNSQLNILTQMGTERYQANTSTSYKSNVYVNLEGDYIYNSCGRDGCGKNKTEIYALYRISNNTTYKLAGLYTGNYPDFFILNSFNSNEIKYCIHSRTEGIQGGSHKVTDHYTQYTYDINANSQSSGINVSKNVCESAYTNPKTINNWIELSAVEKNVLNKFVEFKKSFTMYTETDNPLRGYTTYNLDNAPNVFKNKKFMVVDDSYDGYYALIMYGKKHGNQSWNAFLYYKPEVTISSTTQNIIINND